jgi:hypothetical protein
MSELFLSKYSVSRHDISCRMRRPHNEEHDPERDAERGRVEEKVEEARGPRDRGSGPLYRSAVSAVVRDHPTAVTVDGQGIPLAPRFPPTAGRLTFALALLATCECSLASSAVQVRLITTVL